MNLVKRYGFNSTAGHLKSTFFFGVIDGYPIFAKEVNTDTLKKIEQSYLNDSKFDRLSWMELQAKFIMEQELRLLRKELEGRRKKTKRRLELKKSNFLRR